MLLSLLDGTGALQRIVVRAQEAVSDASGVATGASQVAIPANALRAGWCLQNVGAGPMYVNDLGAPAAAGGASYLLAPGALLSTEAGIPLSTGDINVVGAAGDAFVARQW